MKVSDDLHLEKQKKGNWLIVSLERSMEAIPPPEK
jgi:hypothetical protein